ncbi:hypothetical protein Bbelb_079030, partial [Branchiostoma belcheri]
MNRDVVRERQVFLSSLQLAVSRGGSLLLSSPREAQSHFTVSTRRPATSTAGCNEDGSNVYEKPCTVSPPAVSTGMSTSGLTFPAPGTSAVGELYVLTTYDLCAIATLPQGGRTHTCPFRTARTGHARRSYSYGVIRRPHGSNHCRTSLRRLCRQARQNHARIGGAKVGTSTIRPRIFRIRRTSLERATLCQNSQGRCGNHCKKQEEPVKTPLVPGRGSNPQPNPGTSPQADTLTARRSQEGCTLVLADCLTVEVTR